MRGDYYGPEPCNPVTKAGDDEVIANAMAAAAAN